MCVWGGLGLFAQFLGREHATLSLLGSYCRGWGIGLPAGWLSEMILNVLTHDRFSHCLLPNLRLNFDFATMNSFSNSQFLDRLRFMCVPATLTLCMCMCMCVCMCECVLFANKTAECAKLLARSVQRSGKQKQNSGSNKKPKENKSSSRWEREPGRTWRRRWSRGRGNGGK